MKCERVGNCLEKVSMMSLCLFLSEIHRAPNREKKGPTLKTMSEGIILSQYYIRKETSGRRWRHLAIKVRIKESPPAYHIHQVTDLELTLSPELSSFSYLWRFTNLFSTACMIFPEYYATCIRHPFGYQSLRPIFCNQGFLILLRRCILLEQECLCCELPYVRIPSPKCFPHHLLPKQRIAAFPFLTPVFPLSIQIRMVTFFQLFQLNSQR